MKVGTLLNTYEIVLKLLYDLRGVYFSDDELRRAAWILKHSPQIFLYWAAKMLNLANLSHEKFNIEEVASHLDLEKQIARLREAGTEHIELSLDLVKLLPQIKEWWRTQLPYLVSLKEEGITYSVHESQFAGMNLDSYCLGIRNGAILEFRSDIEFLRLLDPLYVWHVGGERFFRYLGGHLMNPALKRELEKMYGSDWKGKLQIAAAMPLLRKAIEFAKNFIIREVMDKNLIVSLKEMKELIPPEKICFENLEHTDYDTFMKYLMPYRTEVPFSTWLDCGHLIIQKPDDKYRFEKFFEAYGHCLAGIHIHEVVEVSQEVYSMKKLVGFVANKVASIVRSNINAEIDMERLVRDIKDKSLSRLILQDHKPLGVKGGILPLTKILKLVRDLEKKRGDEIPLVVELYYHDPLPSVRFLKQAISEL